MPSPSDDTKGLICSCNAGPFTSARGLHKHLTTSCPINEYFSEGDDFDDLGDSEFVPKRRRVDRRLEKEPIEHEFSYESHDPFGNDCYTHNAPNEDQNVAGLAIPRLFAARRIAVERPPESFNYNVFQNVRHSSQLYEVAKEVVTNVQDDCASLEYGSDDGDDSDLDSMFGEEFSSDPEYNTPGDGMHHFWEDIDPPAVDPTPRARTPPPSFPTSNYKPGKPNEDKYHPDNFDETKLKYFPPPTQERKTLPLELNAQLDLHLILTKAGAPLYLFDSIFDWIKVYQRESPTLFEEANWLSREQLLGELARQHGTENRRATLETMSFGGDARLLTVPRFSFVDEVLSLLHDPHLMKEENFVRGYDILTGKSKDGKDFWMKSSIDPNDLHSSPTPQDGRKKLHHLYCGTKFQMSRDRYCNQDHHMPIPLVLFYDEANVDFFGGLKSAPVMMSLGFFSNFCRARLAFWRVLAIVPNLSLGKGKSNTASPEQKAKEHHQILRSIFKELERITSSGGIKTTVNGKNVVLKFWIHSIIGDTKGHNELCAHNNSSGAKVKMRTCLCLGHELGTIPLKCTAITTELVSQHKALGTLSEIGQKDIDNAFDHLPMGHPTRGVHACTTFDDIHVFGNGLLCYAAEAVAYIMYASPKKKDKKQKSGKGGGRKKGRKKNTNTGKNEPKFRGSKKKRESFDNLFRVVSRLLDRQSERDFPRRSTRSGATDVSRQTAMETVGNVACMVLLIHMKDGETILRKFLDERKITMKSLRQSLIGVLCYQCWLLQSNPASQVVAAGEQVNNVMLSLTTSLRRPEGTDQWHLPKAHGAVLMRNSVIEDGPGEGTTTCHGENMHKYISKGHAKRTQKRAASLTAQMAERHHEHVTLETAARNMSHTLLLRDSSEDKDPSRDVDRNVSYWRSNVKLNDSCYAEGTYAVSIPSVEDLKHKRGFTHVAWTSFRKHKSGVAAFDALLYALSTYARESSWMESFKITGFTSVKKMDVMQNKFVRYRCDPHYRGRVWRDWGNFRYGQAGERPHETQSPAMILGFVRFDTPMFPTPFVKARYEDDPIPATCLDSRLYAVVRGIDVPEGLNFEEKFITSVRLLSGAKAIYILPISSLVGPVCVVPNIHNLDRTVQDKDSWLIMKPRRMWGDHFGRWVDEDKNNVVVNKEDECDAASSAAGALPSYNFNGAVCYEGYDSEDYADEEEEDDDDEDDYDDTEGANA